MKSCGGRRCLRRLEPFGVRALALLLMLAGAAGRPCAANPRMQLPKLSGTAAPLFCLFREMFPLARCPGVRPHGAKRGVLTIIDTRPPLVGRTEVFQVTVTPRAGGAQWTVRSRHARMVLVLNRKRGQVHVIKIDFKGLTLSTPNWGGAPVKRKLRHANVPPRRSDATKSAGFKSRAAPAHGATGRATGKIGRPSAGTRLRTSSALNHTYGGTLEGTVHFKGLTFSPDLRGAPANRHFLDINPSMAWRGSPKAQAKPAQGEAHRVNKKSGRRAGSKHSHQGVCVLLGHGKRELLFSENPYIVTVSLWPAAAAHGAPRGASPSPKPKGTPQ